MPPINEIPAGDPCEPSSQSQGIFLYNVGDAEHVGKATVCRAVRTVCLALKHFLHTFVQFPGHKPLRVIKEEFHRVGGFPNVIGRIDGTHIPIKAPSMNEGDYVNRKSIHSINVQKVKECLNPFKLSTQDLNLVSERLLKEMEKGLKKKTHDSATVKMLPTYVRHTPDGTETGDFLALDLGGTNFRVLLVKVNADGKRTVKLESEICAIPQEIMEGTGKELFNHIADCLARFLDSRNIKDKKLPLGFTFSFPCKQIDLDKSVLIRWTKGFQCSGVVGKDVVQLLREAIQRRGDFDIGSVAVVNDTVGTMMSCGYKDPECQIGLIIGTGTNACYMEELQNVELVDGTEGLMCINMEWGAFGDDGELDEYRTKFDKEVDAQSVNQGKQIFEKMISGMYMGEIVRLILIDLAKENVLFKGMVPAALQMKNSFETRHISEIEADTSSLAEAHKILTSLGLEPSDDDCELVRSVCSAVSTRSADLCAAALAAVSGRIRQNRGVDRLKITVGVDGTVYRKHPKFGSHLQCRIKSLAPQCDVTFMLSEDGSGKGAALVAAVVQNKNMCS